MRPAVRNQDDHLLALAMRGTVWGPREMYTYIYTYTNVKIYSNILIYV